MWYFFNLLDTKDIKNAFQPLQHYMTSHHSSVFVKCLYSRFVFSCKPDLAARSQALCYTPKAGKCRANKDEILSTLSLFTARAAARRTYKCDVALIHLSF